MKVGEVWQCKPGIFVPGDDEFTRVVITDIRNDHVCFGPEDKGVGIILWERPLFLSYYQKDYNV
jgi:hypothetical protein